MPTVAEIVLFVFVTGMCAVILGLLAAGWQALRPTIDWRTPLLVVLSMAALWCVFALVGDRPGLIAAGIVGLPIVVGAAAGLRAAHRS